MLTRCKNLKNDNFPNYGGRGISVCARWEKFPAFLEDMGARPSGTTLDRIDCDGDYNPQNCRWSFCVDQNNNKRNTIRITAFGETKPLMEWARELNLSVNMLHKRVSRGWTGEKILSTPSLRAWGKS